MGGLEEKNTNGKKQISKEEAINLLFTSLHKCTPDQMKAVFDEYDIPDSAKQDPNVVTCFNRMRLNFSCEFNDPAIEDARAKMLEGLEPFEGKLLIPDQTVKRTLLIHLKRLDIAGIINLFDKVEVSEEVIRDDEIQRCIANGQALLSSQSSGPWNQQIRGDFEKILGLFDTSQSKTNTPRITA